MRVVDNDWNLTDAPNAASSVVLIGRNGFVDEIEESEHSGVDI